MILWFCLLSFLGGVPAAWAWGKYFFHMRRGHAIQAALWDMTIGALGLFLTLTLWSMAGNSPLVLVTYLVGSSIGTFFVVKHNQSKKAEQ